MQVPKVALLSNDPLWRHSALSSYLVDLAMEAHRDLKTPVIGTELTRSSVFEFEFVD
jgi:hypothetical protein